MQIINLNDLLEKALFNKDGDFCRYDLPIRLIGIDCYVKYQLLHPLWWKMQYTKLYYWWKVPGKQPEELLIQKCKLQQLRLTDLIDSVQRGDDIKEPITIGKTYSIIDGMHRLAAAVYFDRKELEINIDSEGIEFRPLGCEVWIRQLYTNEEWCLINIIAEKLIYEIRSGKWI